MADNITVADSVIATDEIASVHHQRAKLVHGADGTNDGDVARTNPLPVDAVLNTGVIQSSGSQLTPKFAKFALTATGTVVPAVSDKKIRVLSLAMTCESSDEDETYTFKSGAAGTALTGAFGEATVEGGQFVLVLSFSPVGWFETASGSLLELSIAGTSPHADGCLTYVEV
ncbi:MAG: hypothetical protein V3V96_14445 [Acidiferrobacterales bacterium]